MFIVDPVTHFMQGKPISLKASAEVQGGLAAPQWTTDQQLIQTIRSVGVYDVVELKFAENRANGQSKG